MTPDMKRRPAGNGTAKGGSEADASLSHPAPHEPSAWLVDRLGVILHTPTLPWCGHASDVLTLKLWSAPVLRCVACAHAQPPLTGDDNYRCDRCGTVDHGTRGLVAGLLLPGCTLVDPLAFPRPGQPRTIELLVAFGLCPACLVREYGEVPA